MTSEKAFVLMAKTLLEKALEIEADSGTGMHYQSRKAELERARLLAHECLDLIGRIETKTALEWQAKTGKRIVWRLENWGLSDQIGKNPKRGPKK
jgi:hypothetical protein